MRVHISNLAVHHLNLHHFQRLVTCNDSRQQLEDFNSREELGVKGRRILYMLADNGDIQRQLP